MTEQSKSNVEGFVVESKQIQKAGDGAQQVQAGTINVYNGITEARAREIFSEMNAIARQSYTQDAYDLALKRVGMFEELLMQKVEKVNGLLEAFGDPSFQFLLTEAQKRAAASDRDADIEMITELLVHRVEEKDSRKTKASISKAVEIVDQIDDDALCALTLVYAINNWIAASGNITHGLATMNNLFSSFCYQTPPNGFDWAYHLDILNAVRVSSVGTYKKFSEYYTEQFNGYSCVGIQKNSDAYQKAESLLKEANLPTTVLVEHELNSDFVRLNVSDKQQIKNITIPTFIQPHTVSFRKTTEAEVEILNKIWNLYSNDSKLKENFKNAFMRKWDSFETLKSVRLWWEALPHSMTITPVGKVLAHANAQRYNSNIPDIKF